MAFRYKCLFSGSVLFLGSGTTLYSKRQNMKHNDIYDFRRDENTHTHTHYIKTILPKSNSKLLRVTSPIFQGLRAEQIKAAEVKEQYLTAVAADQFQVFSTKTINIRNIPKSSDVEAENKHQTSSSSSNPCVNSLVVSNRSNTRSHLQCRVAQRPFSSSQEIGSQLAKV